MYIENDIYSNHSSLYISFGGLRKPANAPLQLTPDECFKCQNSNKYLRKNTEDSTETCIDVLQCVFS